MTLTVTLFEAHEREDADKSVGSPQRSLTLSFISQENVSVQLHNEAMLSDSCVLFHS